MSHMKKKKNCVKIILLFSDLQLYFCLSRFETGHNVRLVSVLIFVTGNLLLSVESGKCY